MRNLTKNLNGLLKISLLCFAFFLLSPSIPVNAMFSDTVNQTLGIQLEFGTISLDPIETKIVDSVKFTAEEPVKIASSTLVNKGSLSAKLAYKIDVTKEDGSILTIEELKNMVISIDLGSAANNVDATASSLNTHSFTFVKNTSDSDVVIEPNSVDKVPVSISYKSSVPTKEEKLKIMVTFKMIQSNTLDANDNLFSDTLTIENIVSLVPEVVEKENYWPSESTFVKSDNGKFTYSLEKMTMLYSDTYESLNSDTRQIKNLNKAVLYVQFPENEPLTQSITKSDGTKEIKPTFIFSDLTTGNETIEVESKELSEEHHGMIITFKLNDSYTYNPQNVRANAYVLSMNISIQKYSMYNLGQYGQYDHAYKYIPYFATQLVLSSDIPSEIDAWNFEHKEILLSEVQKSIAVKKLMGSSHWVKKDDFENIQWNKEVINFEIIEKNNTKIISYLANKDRTVNLWTDSNNSQIFTDATLNVKITGDTGNTLVISRKLEMQKDTSMLRKNFLNEEQLVEDAVTQSNTEESEEDSVAEVESSTTIVEEPAKEVIEEPVIESESQEADEVVDPTSIEMTIEINENIPEVTKEDKETIAENE